MPWRRLRRSRTGESRAYWKKVGQYSRRMARWKAMRRRSRQARAISASGGLGWSRDAHLDELALSDLRAAELAARAHQVAAFGAAAFGVAAGIGEPAEEGVDAIFVGGGPGGVAAGVVGD